MFLRIIEIKRPLDKSIMNMNLSHIHYNNIFIKNGFMKKNMAHELPELGYEYDALEPFFDARTMEIHHSKHHAGYVKKLNKALEGHDGLLKKDVKDLIKDLNELPDEVKKGVRNNGGGHYNHSLFWKILKKDVEPKGEVVEKIKVDYGSVDDFKEKFREMALSVFGSGWAWLVYSPESDKLEIVKTQNQDNPLTEGKVPLLEIDMWEHAYYLKHQNEKAKYVDDFLNIINWDQVNENYLEAKKD